MLVLSRRPSEKILFPSVGISVEIIQTKGNTVRVGIEAPEDVRILRDELKTRSTDQLVQANKIVLSNQTSTDELGQDEKLWLAERIDEIGLAVALAQNQQRQGLTETVDIALEQAIERLRELKERLIPTESKPVVCEPNVAYSTQKDEVRLAFEDRKCSHFRLDFSFVASSDYRSGVTSAFH